MNTNIKGAKAGSSKSRTPVVASDSAQSIVLYKILMGMAEGEIEGLANGWKSVYLDDTPILDASGNSNFESVTRDFRTGTNDQDYIEGFVETSNINDVNVELTTQWVRSISNTSIDAIRVLLRFGALRTTNPKNGDVTGVLIKYAIDISTDGAAYVEMINTAINDKTSDAYVRPHRIDLPRAQTGWNIRVRRLTPPANSDYITDKMYIDSYSEVIDAKLSYPNTALLSLQYDAQTFSNAAKVAVEAKGIKVRVPTNYNPESRQYVGIWDGSFKRAYSNNPAWIYYDLCTAKRYGLGERISDAMLDKASLYRLAQYCDGMVSDGEGGLEPRFTCNIYIQSAEDAFSILTKLAGLFRAISYWDGDSIICEADAPDDVYYAYTNANVIDGNFEGSGTRNRDRHNVAKVAWDDPKNRYKTDYEIVRDERAIAEAKAVRIVDVDAWGCTSRGQAQRAGLWALRSEQNETQTVTFKVGLDGQITPPGKIISVADNDFAGRFIGGRIKAISADRKTITLDRDVLAQPNDTIYINSESGHSVQRQLASINGQVVTVSQAFNEGEVAAQNAWNIDSTDLKTRKFRVVSLTQDDEHQFTITAVEYNAAKYDAIDNGAFIDDVPTTIINPVVQAPATNVQIESYDSVQQGINIATMIIKWVKAEYAVKYLVEWRKDNDSWIKMPTTGATSVEIPGIYAGNYQARVTAISAFDITSLAASSVLTSLQGKQGKPLKLAGINAEGILFGMKLTWLFPAVGALDTAYTEIEVSPDSISNIVQLGLFSYPTTVHTIQGMQPNLRQYYRGRLIDRIGNVGDWSDWISGITSADASDVLELLDGQITDSQLNQDLISRIELGSEAKDLVVEVNKIATATSLQVDKLTNELTAETAQRRDDTKALNDALTQETVQRREGIKELNDGLTQEIKRSKDADKSQIETLDNYKASIDGSLSNVQTSISTIATATEANSSKLTALDSAIDGKADASVVQNLKNDVVTIGDQVNTQSSIITGLQNTVVNKADASVVQNLKNDVVTIGDQVNSQSNILTGLQNTLAGKADASALTALDSKVSTIDGKVTSQGQAITALENSIAGKADASAVNQLKTTVEQQGNTISSQGQAITKVEAKVENIAVGSENLIDEAGVWSTGLATGGDVATLSSDLSVLYVWSGGTSNYVTGMLAGGKIPRLDANCNDDDDVIFSVEMLIESGSVPQAPLLYWKDAMNYMPLQLAKGQVQRYDVWQRYYHTRKYVKGYNIPHFSFPYRGVYRFRRPIFERGNIPAAWNVSDTDFATARAVQTLDAKVTTIGDKTNANAEAITDLRTSISNKADSSALNSLKSTVEQQGNTLTSQGQAITSVSAQAGETANKVGLTRNWSIFTFRNGDSQHEKRGLYNALGEWTQSIGRGLNLYEFNRLGDLVKYSNFDTYASWDACQNMADAIGLIPYGNFFAIAGCDNVGNVGWDEDQRVVNLRNVLINCGFRLEDLRNWTGNRMPIAITRRSATVGSPVYVLFDSPHNMDWFSHSFTLVDGTPVGFGTNTQDRQNTFANATAISKLDATVVQHGQDISAQAQSITGLQSSIAGKADVNALNQLETRVNQQGNTITAQGTALTQVEAKSDMALNGKKTIVDLSGLNPNLYYPVFMNINSIGIAEIEIVMNLGTEQAPWSSHGGGSFAMSLRWTTKGSGWGAQEIDRQIINSNWLWTQSQQAPFQDISQQIESSREYVYLRGGTKYHFTCNQYVNGAPFYEGSGGVGYVPSLVPVSISAKLGVTALATQTLDAKVTEVNGRVEAQAGILSQVQTTAGNAVGNILLDSNKVTEKPVGSNPYPFWARETSKPLVAGKWYTLVYEAEFQSGGAGSEFRPYIHGAINFEGTNQSFGRQVKVVRLNNSYFSTGTVGNISFYITGSQPDQNNSYAKVYWACLYEDTVAQPVLQWQPNNFETTALVQQSLNSINGIKAQYTVKTDVNGYVAGIGLINEGSGKSLFIIRADQFAIAAPASVGNEAKYAFNYQAGPVTLPNGTVVPAGLYLDNANIGYISATKIYADSLSAISANLGTIKVKEGNIDDLAVSTLKIKDNAVTVPVGIKLVSPIQRSSQRSATVFTGGDAVIQDTSNYFGDIISLSLNRSGGKCQISGYVYVDNVCASAWRSNGSTVGNAPKTMYCGVVLYKNGSPIFIGRVASSSETTNDVAVFNGAVQLPTIIDDAHTGNVQYSIRVGWSTTISDAGLMIRPWNTGNASVLTATLSVLELKK